MVRVLWLFWRCCWAGNRRLQLPPRRAFTSQAAMLTCWLSCMRSPSSHPLHPNPTAGLATALETLVGQAVGARKYRQAGVYLQAAMLTCGLACVPILTAWHWAGGILAHLGQRPEVAQGTARVLGWMAPAVVVSAVMEPTAHYLVCQVGGVQLLNLSEGVVCGAGLGGFGTAGESSVAAESIRAFWFDLGAC